MANSQNKEWRITPHSLLLKFCLPKTVQVAVLIDRNRLVGTGAELALRLIGQVYALTSVFGFKIDKGDMVLRKHWVRHAAHLNLDTAVVELCNYGNVLLAACINSTRYQLLHLLATAYHRYARINTLVYYISAMFADIKFCCHNSIFLKVCTNIVIFSEKEIASTLFL